MTTLSAPSRITSSSNSFQPMTLCSTSTEPTGESSSPRSDQRLELLAVVGDAAAGAAERERRPDDGGIAGVAPPRPAPPPRVRTVRPGGVASPMRRIACGELARGPRPSGWRARWRRSARRRTRSSVPSRCSAIATLSAVWPPIVGSSASGRSRSMTLRHPLGRHRLDVGPVGQLRVGHDRRRIRVDQDDPVALLLERAHRLRARSSRTRRPAR